MVPDGLYGPARLNTKPPWKDNFTVVYTGQVYTDTGKIGFKENIDDVTWVKLNGDVIINDSTWNVLAQAQADLGTPGWYDIEIRFSNGGGGAGSITGIGFAVDPDGPGGQDWMAASNEIFRYYSFPLRYTRCDSFGYQCS